MGMCFLHGKGNAGRPDFRILGGLEAPKNPREGDIWLKTEEPITGYTITSLTMDDLTELEEKGHVAISGNRSDPTAFTRLVKVRIGSVAIAPSRYCQYDGEKWTALEMHIYQNRQWITMPPSWNGELYDAGDEFAEYTGGWTDYSYFGEKMLNIQRQIDANIEYRTVGAVYTGGWKHICLDGFSGKTDKNGVVLGFGALKFVTFQEKDGTVYYSVVKHFSIKKSLGEQKYDITDLPPGRYYIFIGSNATDGYGIVDVKKVWLE